MTVNQSPDIAPDPSFTIRSGTIKEEKRRYAGIDLGKRDYSMAIIGTDKKLYDIVVLCLIYS